MEFATSPRGMPSIGHGSYKDLATLVDGISALWALHSEGEERAPERYALADGCAYLLFAFDAERAGRRELLHARLIGPRTKPFLIDVRPRLRVGVRYARASFSWPLDSRLGSPRPARRL